MSVRTESTPPKPALRARAYVIPSARLTTDGGVWQAGTAPASRLSPLLGTVLFALVGVFMLSAGNDAMLFSLLFFALAAGFAAAYPMASQVRVDPAGGHLSFFAEYLVRFPRRVEWRIPLSDVARVDLQSGALRLTHTVSIVFLDGTRLNVQFRNRQPAEELALTVKNLASAASSAALTSPEAVAAAQQSETQAVMFRELQGWAVWLLLMGLLQFISAGGFSSWGALLVGVGLLSFVMRVPGMFIIYAVTVGWAGLANLLYGELFWKGFALLQAYWVYGLFRQFARFRQSDLAGAAAGAESLPVPSGALSRRAALIFPWVALVCGVGSALLFGLLLLGIGAIIFGLAGNSLTAALSVLESVAVMAGLMGLAAGLAGWLSRYPLRPASFIGGLAGGLTVLADLVLGML